MTRKFAFSRRLSLVSALLASSALAQNANPTAAQPSLLQTVTPAAQVNPATPTGMNAPLPTPVPASVASAPEPTGPSVYTRVAQGRLAGVQSDGVNYFLGVPYAAPPVRALRWQPPQPLLPWAGERSAAHYGNICPQRPNLLDPQNDNQLHGNEDCLLVNVYAPKNVKNAPVMVWIHGGSFDSGTANQYDGSELARRYGVVVVTVEYRLSVLGFLAASALDTGKGSGNYGLMDIQAALRWTGQNAAAFGGDKKNITVFGESAGGMAICSLLTAPSSQGLFQKAIMESGPCNRGVGSAPIAQVRRSSDDFAKLFGCTGELAASCLRSVDTRTLVNTPLPGTFVPGSIRLPPAYNTPLLPEDPRKAFAEGKVIKVPLMIGSNRNEGTPFTAYLTPKTVPLGRTLYFALVSVINAGHATQLVQQYPSSKYPTAALAGAALVTDGLFACPVDDFGRSFSAYAPTYRYEFSDPQAATVLRPTASIPTLGSFHASEIVYIFNRPIRGLADPANFSPNQARLADEMGRYWTNFARTGNPNGVGPSNQPLPNWPAYNADNKAVLSLRPTGNVVNTQFPEEHQCDFWKRIDGLL